MTSLKSMLPYLAVILADFYLLPVLIRSFAAAILILLIAIPLICFVCSAVFGAKHSFHIWYAVLVAALFVPSVFIFYNATAWPYAVGYGVAALAGNAIGSSFSKKA
jgi:hypothetical protein